MALGCGTPTSYSDYHQGFFFVYYNNHKTLGASKQARYVLTAIYKRQGHSSTRPHMGLFY